MSESTAQASPAAEPIPVTTSQLLETAEQASQASAEAVQAARLAQEALDLVRGQASEIARLKGEAEAAAGWFTAAKQNAEASQTDSRAALAAALAALESSRQDVLASQADAQSNRDAVREMAEHIESKVDALEKIADTAETDANAIASTKLAVAEQMAAASASAEKAAELLDEVVKHHDTVTEQSETVTELAAEIGGKLAEATELVKGMAATHKRAGEALSVIAAHEKELARLTAEFAALHTRIESLLPNATSAGLASAFRTQKARFDLPQKGWLMTFIVAILALMGSSVYGLPVADPSWDAIARHLVNRLPLIAPLVWLAVYAGRHYGLALRLQEEYAYKEAVSTAFEGYKREMNTVSIGTDGGPNPLVTLCENVLKTLSQRPGRIYEGRHEDITAFTPATEATKNVLGGLMKAKPAPPSSDS